MPSALAAWPLVCPAVTAKSTCRTHECDRLIDQDPLGGDPAVALPLTAEVTYQTFGHTWIRVGQAGEWAFAINYSLVDLEGPAVELSAGAEVARFEMGVNADYFYFYADGTEVTSFEPLLACHR